MSGTTVHVLGVGGTLRSDSVSLRALEYSLGSASTAGATVELLSLHNLDLPMFIPGVPEDQISQSAKEYLEKVRRADALLLSTGAYHGTMAGVTKNALDYLEYLAKDHPPYLQDRVIGLIAAAGGEMAGVRSLDAMVHVVHALRGVVVPLQVVIPQSRKALAPDAEFESNKWAVRLDRLGRLVVDMALKQRPEPAIGS